MTGRVQQVLRVISFVSVTRRRCVEPTQTGSFIVVKGPVKGSGQRVVIARAAGFGVGWVKAPLLQWHIGDAGFNSALSYHIRSCSPNQMCLICDWMRIGAKFSPDENPLWCRGMSE